MALRYDVMFRLCMRFSGVIQEQLRLDDPPPILFSVGMPDGGLTSRQSLPLSFVGDACFFPLFFLRSTPRGSLGINFMNEASSVARAV